MSRPRRVITDKKERAKHEAALERRRRNHAWSTSIQALQDGGEGAAEFDKLLDAERERQGVSANHRGAVKGAAKSPKLLTAARENLTAAFDLMGGVPALVIWGRANSTEFYRLWARLIPKESVEVSATLPLEALLAKLSNHESMSVGEAAYQIGTDILNEARDMVIEHDATVGLAPEDEE